MVIHIRETNGAAKCGCNVYIHHEWDEKGNIISTERRISHNQPLCFASPEHPATCRRCLNQVARPQIVPVNDDYANAVFRRSFGYDMTFNVYARVIGKTRAGGLLVQECHTCVDGDAWEPGGNGRATAGAIIKESKPFTIYKKQSANGYEYWSGGGENWAIWNGKPNYENHCD